MKQFFDLSDVPLSPVATRWAALFLAIDSRKRMNTDLSRSLRVSRSACATRTGLKTGHYITFGKGTGLKTGHYKTCGKGTGLKTGHYRTLGKGTRLENRPLQEHFSLSKRNS